MNKTLWVTALLLVCACSSTPENPRASEPGSPTILTARTEPGTIELNRDLQPLQNPKVIVEVKDFHSSVTDVTLVFDNVPLSVPMRNINGVIWEVELTSRQLEMMAVSGQTVKYGAQVVARNADGKTARSEEPVEIAVKAPELARPSTT